MAKTLADVSEVYDDLVREVFSETGLENTISIKVFAMAKPGKDVIKITRAPELAEKAWDEEDIIAVSIYEEAFDRVDDQTRRIWIENALAQVSYDYEKDRLNLNKEPSINLTLGMYDKYNDKGLGGTLIQKIQLQALTVQQIKDEEKQKKAEAKAAKKAKKQAE